MIIAENIAVIADDLTGANDTALQFQLRGAETRIFLGNEIKNSSKEGGIVWAVSTESRNVSPEEAYDKIIDKLTILKNNKDIDYLYKKIDSTIRGNIGTEIKALVDFFGYDAAIIAPAFPSEGRTTIGGYQLLNGLPLERTEFARDPKAPVFESHIPSLLRRQLGTEHENLIGHIGFSTVIKGAGPILMEMNKLINNGKKFIVFDAVSVTDLEQIVLAYKKTSHKLLPAGSAALAQVLGNTWLEESERFIDEIKTPHLPKLVISGSATKTNAKQIEKLESSGDFANMSFIPLTNEDILSGVTDELLNNALSKLDNSDIVVIHTSYLVDNFDGFSDDSVNENLTRESFINKITGFLAELTKQITERKEVILITLGGETSYKCCEAVGVDELKIIDEVSHAIALSTDYKNRFFVAKSGNLGDSDTLIDILNYFKRHEQV